MIGLSELGDDFDGVGEVVPLGDVRNASLSSLVSNASAKRLNSYVTK
jgi:hypothetical protein